MTITFKERGWSRDDYKGWEIVPHISDRTKKLVWGAKREHSNGHLTYAGGFESRALAEAWVDDNEVGFTGPDNTEDTSEWWDR